MSNTRCGLSSIHDSDRLEGESMYRIVGIFLVAMVPISGHMLEVSYDESPFKTSSTIEGSVRNVSGSLILVDVRIIVFAFGRNGVFLGHGSNTIQGPIRSDPPSKFRLNVNIDYRNVKKFFLQFEGGDTVLSHEVKDGPRPEAWPDVSVVTQARSQNTAQQQSVVEEPPEGCKLLVVGMASDQSANRLTINGRLKNISGERLFYWGSEGTAEIRVTMYDAVGAYFSEDSTYLSDCTPLQEGAECAFRYSDKIPDVARSYELEFMTSTGNKIPHCLK